MNAIRFRRLFASNVIEDLPKTIWERKIKSNFIWNCSHGWSLWFESWMWRNGVNRVKHNIIVADESTELMWPEQRVSGHFWIFRFAIWTQNIKSIQRLVSVSTESRPIELLFRDACLHFSTYHLAVGGIKSLKRARHGREQRKKKSMNAGSIPFKNSARTTCSIMTCSR